MGENLELFILLILVVSFPTTPVLQKCNFIYFHSSILFQRSKEKEEKRVEVTILEFPKNGFFFLYFKDKKNKLNKKSNLLIYREYYYIGINL